MTKEPTPEKQRPKSSQDQIADTSKNLRFYLLLFCLIIGAFYVSFASPGIGWRDGPEFTVTSVFLDVGHPSGFPTYNLLSKIVTFLPFGSIGLKVTIFTALMAALSLYVFALLLKGLHSLSSDTKPRLFLLLFPLVLYALDSAIYVSATELEVYSLNTLFLLSLFYFAYRWYRGDGIAWLYAGAFVYGLSAGNHAAMGLYLPVLLLLTIWGVPYDDWEKRSYWKHIKRILILALFFMIGLSVYLLLIVRSGTDRLPVDFGRTNTWERFWLHLTDAKDSNTHFQGMFKLEDLGYMAKIQFKNLCSPLFWFSLPFFGWGLRYLWKNYQILAVAIPLLIFINLGFFYYWIDGSSAFIPAITVYFLSVFLGLGELGRILFNDKSLLKKGKFLLKRGLGVVTILFLISSAIFMGYERLSEKDNVSGFQAVELYFDDLANLPPDSIVVHDMSWFPLLALQHTYALRPDVSLIFMTGLLNPGLMVTPEQVKFPRLSFPKGPFGKDLSPMDPDFAFAFFGLNIEEGKRVFFQYGPLMTIIIPYLAPNEDFRFLGELKADPLAGIEAVEDGGYDKLLERMEAYWNSLKNNDEADVAKKAPTYLYYILTNVLEYLYDHGRYETAYDTLERFLKTFTDKNGEYKLTYDIVLNSHAFLADNARKMKNYKEAERLMKTLIDLRPTYPANYLLLGLIYDEQNMENETLEAYKKAAELDQLGTNPAYRYGQALAKYRSIQEAVSFLEEKERLLIEDGQLNAASLIDRYRACVLLPPEIPDLPPPNRIFGD